MNREDRYHALAAEAAPLIGEDLRNARERLGITSAAAAKKARISWPLYRRIENGKALGHASALASVISAARSLGLDSVRMCRIEELDEYVRYDLTEDQPFTLFTDSFSCSLSELRKQGHYVSPYNIFRLVDEIGQETLLKSCHAVDKTIFELWVTALHVLSLDDAHSAYYIRPIRDTAPDTEILITDYISSSIQVQKIEVSQYEDHSDNFFDLMLKKLSKSYDQETTVVIYASKRSEVSVRKLYDFIRNNNPDDRKVEIVTGNPHGYDTRIIPCSRIQLEGLSL